MIKKMIWLCLVVSSLANIACGEQPSSYDKRDKKIMNNLTLYFHKETGAQFITRTQAVSSNPLPTSTTTFYNLDWDKHPIDLQIDHGQHSITLHHVIGLQTGVGNSNEFIDSYNVFAGLTNANTMSHDQARLEMLTIFKLLKSKGWERFISLSDPRLSGKDAMNYAKAGFYELDPDYQYTLNEWMQLESGSQWTLQANGIYLTIRIYHEQSKTTPQIGDYAIHYDFVSEKQYYAPYFKDDDLKKWEVNATRWVSLYPGIKKQMNQIRVKTEAELKAQGIQIDESYQDPQLVSKK